VSSRICSRYVFYSLLAFVVSNDSSAPCYSLAGGQSKIPRTLSSGGLVPRVNEQYQESVVEQGRWKNTYAASRAGEYSAEGAAAFFNTKYNGPVGGDGVHNDINTREEFRRYDPGHFEIHEELWPSEVIGGLNISCPPNSRMRLCLVCLPY